VLLQPQPFMRRPSKHPSDTDDTSCAPWDTPVPRLITNICLGHSKDSILTLTTRFLIVRVGRLLESAENKLMCLGHNKDSILTLTTRCLIVRVGRLLESLGYGTDQSLSKP
jgi:hypothetical protein